MLLVGSGRTGVGKSCLSLHLARALARAGGRVGVLDMDGRLARLHALVTAPGRSGPPSGGPMERAGIRAGSGWIPGVDILPWADVSSAWRAASNGDPKTAPQAPLGASYDYLLLDCSADLTAVPCHGDVQALLLVLTPDVDVLTHSFARLAALRRRGYSGPVLIVVNRVANSRQAWRIFQRFNMAAEQHLGCSCQWLAFIPAGGMQGLPDLLRGRQPGRPAPGGDPFGKMAAMLEQHFHEELPASDLPLSPEPVAADRDRKSASQAGMSAGEDAQAASFAPSGRDDTRSRWSVAHREVVGLISGGGLSPDLIAALLEDMIAAAGASLGTAAADLACRLLSSCGPDQVTPEQCQTLALALNRLSECHPRIPLQSVGAASADSAPLGADMDPALGLPLDPQNSPRGAFDVAGFGGQEDFLRRLRQADRQASLFTLLTALRQHPRELRPEQADGA